MCGVVSIIYENENIDLGIEASFLLKKLEYRGYDSTGAAFFDNGKVTLRKKVGAPSKVVDELELEKFSGNKFIGQVRWATFGAVTDDNAQPHTVSCCASLTGAHNGNVTNTDVLKEFLVQNGHRVVSDNDGEMLVHTIEHFFAENQKRNKKQNLQTSKKIDLMLRAIRDAHKLMKGSYAACISQIDIDGIFAIKSGSSLYAGIGFDKNGTFIVVSSDLTSVLSKTRFLIPLNEGEGIYYNHNTYFVFSLNKNKKHIPQPRRSKLSISDISLHPGYKFFMEQEIDTTPSNLDPLLLYYFNDKYEKSYFEIFNNNKADCKKLYSQLLKLYSIFDRKELNAAVDEILKDRFFKELLKKLKNNDASVPKSKKDYEFISNDSELLNDLLTLNELYIEPLKILDILSVWSKKRKTLQFKTDMIELIKRKAAAGGKIFMIGAGTSYHASLVGSYFFNNIAHITIIPANPGAFRNFYINSLTGKDLIIPVSQSGETKDLVDIINDIQNKYSYDISIVSVVNNENSTIPHEKSDFYLPILCGPEIAVAATKSFTNQCALFYLIAYSMNHSEAKVRHQISEIQDRIRQSLKRSKNDIFNLAKKLFIKPSIHFLGASMIGLAYEGALKVREVVLNHTEGFDAAEFKHGPNTILGKNTIYSLSDMEDNLEKFTDFFLSNLDDIYKMNKDTFTDFLKLIKKYKYQDFKNEIVNYKSNGKKPSKSLEELYNKFSKQVNIEDTFSDYPLIFLCPPDERDKRITIAQIHTHKIRGAEIILIAEEDEELEKAVSGRPKGNNTYYSNFISLPKSGDRFHFVFEASVLVQLLAFRMSVLKMKYLNKLHVESHGVHPDVPKNVSKSITVD